MIYFQHSLSGLIFYVLLSFCRLAISAARFLVVFDHSTSSTYHRDYLNDYLSSYAELLEKSTSVSMETKNLKNFNFLAPFYGWGSTASRPQPLRGGSLLFTTVLRNSWYRPRMDERLCRPWRHQVVLNTGPLD